MKNLIILALMFSLLACNKDDQTLKIGTDSVKIISPEDLSDVKNYRHFLEARNTDILTYFDTDVIGDWKSTKQVIYSTINPIKLKYDNQALLEDEDRKVSDDFLDQILGKNTLISVSSHSNVLLEKEVYLPKPLEVFNIPGTLDTNFFSKTYRISKKNFQIETNVDPNNENGILIFVGWDGLTGNTTFDDIENAERVAKQLLLYTNQDNGKIIIPESVLAAFPSGANVWFLINRGNFENYSSNGTSITVGSRTEYLLKTILE